MVYFMLDVGRSAGFRSLVRACGRVGAAAVELGFPFSDPIADGPVLQEAAARALAGGTGWTDLLSALRTASRELPTAVMSYANPILHRGLSNACEEIAAAGGTGLIVPDLAVEESRPWRTAARRSGLCLVQMASPATPPSRARALARATSGFLYLVTRYGTTGHGVRPTERALRSVAASAHAERPRLPVLMGFGIRSAHDVDRVREIGADGAVVGTAVEERLRRSSSPEGLERFLRPLVRGIERAGADGHARLR